MFANAASYLLVAVAALHPVLAGVYITSPVGTTAVTGGQVIDVKWADDGNTPTVGSIGPCSIDIYTGSTNNQIKLQNLAASVDVSKASSISATINPTIGQNDSHYFVRFTSLNFKDPKNPQYPYEAFSAMFSISAMTGTFNATTLAAIDAASASNSSSLAAASGLSPSGSSGASRSSATASGSRSSASSSASSAPASSGAQHLLAPASMALALVGVASYLVL
ncbi:hypothetical protein IAR55_002973 [Kwoniella newhampshirensis]|uniref:Yeast cell wall synthesis Kre9/Knh1-like N-terminal domain-containing protein n=1 Tax=Kwoniella newhampshirensis TaxID=1651941 RepID=A0AAW0YP29_9TREE